LREFSGSMMILIVLDILMCVSVNSVIAQECNVKVDVPSVVPPNTTFVVSIIAENIPNQAGGMAGWELILSWTPGVINCTAEQLNYAYWPANSGPLVAYPIDNDAGTYHQSLVYKAPSTPVTGTYWLVNLTFYSAGSPTPVETDLIVGPGPSMVYCLVDKTATEIPHGFIQGHVTIMPSGCPVAIFTYIVQLEEREVTFDASASYDPDGFIVRYDWEFGDGETGMGMIVTYKYKTRTVYVVKLTVTDNDGLTDITTKTVTLGNFRAISIEPVQVVWGVDERIEKAIAWALDELGSTEYANKCLRFVWNAYELTGAEIPPLPYKYAKQAADALGAKDNSGAPPRGAYAFYDCSGTLDGEYRNWGHVGLSLGNGDVVHAFGKVRIDNYLDIQNLSPGVGWTNPQYIGWAYPPLTPPIKTSNLVQDKATDFRIGYESTFDVIKETDIKLETPGFIPTIYQFKYKFAPGSHSFIIGSEIATSPFFSARTKPEAAFKFTIDPSNLISETDETDNTFPRTDFEKRKVTDTKRLNILFVAVRFDGEDGYPSYFNGFSRAAFEEHGVESINYIKATYPLAESEVYYTMACFNWPVNAGPRPTTEAEADTRFTVLLHTLSLRANSYYDRVVGVVKNNWFAGIPGWSDTIGFAGQGWGKGAVVTVEYWKTSPHEIGHTYNLGHSNDNGEGYYVIGRRSVNAQTFMSTGEIPWPPAQNPYRTAVPSFWIRTTEYQTLLGALTKTADPEILLVSGRFWRNGTVALDDWYRFPSGTPDFEEGDIGNYSVAQIDGTGNMLSVIGFNVTFEGAIYGRSFEVIPLAFTIPYATGTRTVQIRNATGHVVASRIISDNAPTVRVLSPNGGEILTSDQVQVSWEASDLDGDPLVYNLLISGDGGLTWNPLETGLNQTTFDLPLTGFSGGNNYIVKVIASDGANTGEDVSDGFFSIASFTVDVVTPPQIVPLGGKANYTLNITSYGGFTNPIILNASSTTTDKLVFRWVTGSTLIPVPDGSTTTVVEVEVTEATEGGNHTLILTGTSGNNTEVAITYLFTESHDLAVTNITPSKTVAGQGFPIIINVTIQNQGNFGETFTASLYENQTLILNQSIYASARISTTLTFIWNTSGFTYGNYTISAFAWPVVGETATEDNNFTDGWVFVGIPGDVNGDTYVNIKDAVLLGVAFGSKQGEPTYNPNADINCDGYINIKDAVIQGANFGKSWT